MPTTERDYYELLGVSRTATEQEIKMAFRRLARELHPDVSDHPEADVRFREVSEAYEALSNAETRQLYDRYGHAGLKSGGFHPSHFDLGNVGDLFSAFFGEDLFGGRRGGRGGARGADISAEVHLDLVEAARGVTVPLTADIAGTCASCQGSGAAPGSQVVMCPRCAGHGRVQQVARGILGEFVRQSTCPECHGAGRKVEKPCSDCEGAGLKVSEHTIDVEIPAGIDDGQRIRITGEGHAGEPGGRPGDIYVQVRVRPDDRFVREGNDLFSQVHLTIVEAAIGARIPVATLEGTEEIEFEPGTQPGEVRVLRGKGMPVLQGFGHGDQRVVVNVLVPRRVTVEQQNLLERFERLSGEDTYRPDQGFFDKLKSAFH